MIDPLLRRTGFSAGKYAFKTEHLYKDLLCLFLTWKQMCSYL